MSSDKLWKWRWVESFSSLGGMLDEEGEDDFYYKVDANGGMLEDLLGY